jgi:hypothetical protein
MTDARSIQLPVSAKPALNASGALAAVLLFVLPCAMGAWIAFSQSGPTWFETLHCAGLFAVVLAAMVFAGGAGKLSASATGRIILVGCVAAATVALNPAFHILSTGLQVSDSVVEEIVPIIGCFLLWAVVSTLESPVDLNVETGAERFEALLKKPGVRLNLFFTALLGIPVMAAMSGMSLRAALWPVAFSGALMLALNGLFKLAGSARCAWALSVFVLVASGTIAVLGYSSYRELRNETQQTVASLQVNRFEDVKKEYDIALKMTDKVRTNGPRIEMETALALEFEKQNRNSEALSKWERVADLTKVDRNTFAPIRRVRCALGDSLPPWRSLVFEGFPAIDNPEMAPGVMRLAEIAGDNRSKLLGALLAWDRQAPEAERRKLLLAVQAIAPGEPTSLNLLKRLGGPVKDAPMWLPGDLIVGTAPTIGSILGNIEELGEVCTLVCLNTGRWEMSLRASGTPLHEEWPIVRVELDGIALATTQVNKAVEYDVPFTFDVKRNDIFKVRIILQNRQEDVEEGRAARRGLKISGIKFSRAELKP